MATIWFDALTPKHAWLFGTLGKFLREKGEEVIITTREYERTEQILDFFDFKHFTFGKHGGDSLKNKLLESTNRIKKLTNFITGLNKRLLCAAALMSPEAARVAFGLGIPFICFNDTPHATAVSRLVYPLSTYYIIPKCIPQDSLLSLGAKHEQIFQFDGIFEALWVPKIKRDKSILRELGLDENRPIVVIRPEESEAAYLLEKENVKDEKSRSGFLIYALLENKPEVQIVFFPRYEKQRRIIETTFKDKIIMPKKAINGPNLMSFVDLVITGGGTMSQEAALLGIPSISYFHIDYTVKQYLREKGFPYFHQENLLEVIKLSLDMLNNPRKYRLPDDNLMRLLEDPRDVMFKIIKSLKGKTNR
ncbi:MAG: DUF354 domain-containing protein [Candidatus Helarchaeota archaeon]